MSDTFTIKRNDLEPALKVECARGGAALDLSAAASVRLLLRNSAGLKVDSAMTGDAEGVATYDWAEGDTDTAGTFKGEVEVTWSGGRTETFPSDGYFRVKVLADLDDVP